MSMTVMLAGTLAKRPEQRTSKNGNSYCTATVRVPAADGDVYANATAFGDLAGTLAGLQRGDPITIIGQGKLSTYQSKDGEHRAGLSVTASRIIALTDHQAPRKARSRSAPDSREFASDFEDAVPF